MNEIVLHGKKYTAPSRWDEVNESQLLAWAAICLKELSKKDATRLCLKIFYRMPLLTFFKIPESWRIQIEPTIDFLWTGQLPTKWIIKKIAVLPLSAPYHGPDDRLANCTILEFRYAMMFYQAYVKSNNEEYLDQLIATLFRPKRKGTIKNDIREDLSDFGIQTRARRMRKLSPKFRHAILLNFEGCYSFIQKNYLNKLPKDGSGSAGIFDFNGIIRTVSGSKFGAKKETEQTLIYDFLEHLIETSEEVERMKRENR